MVPLVSFLVSVSIAVVQVLTPLRRKERAKTRLASEFGNQIGECRLYVRNFSTIVIVAESSCKATSNFIHRKRKERVADMMLRAYDTHVFSYDILVCVLRWHIPGFAKCTKSLRL